MRATAKAVSVVKSNVYGRRKMGRRPRPGGPTKVVTYRTGPENLEWLQAQQVEGKTISQTAEWAFQQGREYVDATQALEARIDAVTDRRGITWAKALEEAFELWLRENEKRGAR